MLPNVCVWVRAIENPRISVAFQFYVKNELKAKWKLSIDYTRLLHNVANLYFTQLFKS